MSYIEYFYENIPIKFHFILSKYKNLQYCPYFVIVI